MTAICFIYRLERVASFIDGRSKSMFCGLDETDIENNIYGVGDEIAT